METKEKKVDNENIENQEPTKTDKKWTDIFKSINESEINENKEDRVVEKLTKENQILKNNLLVVTADLENTRKRQQDELEKASKFAVSKLVGDLLPIMDSFYLAEKNVNEEKLSIDNDYKIFVDGTNITFNELKRVFERYNIVRINPIGEQFDHNLHQAISQVESEEEEGTIVSVVQAGYSLNGRLLKPALVIVSKGNDK